MSIWTARSFSISSLLVFMFTPDFSTLYKLVCFTNIFVTSSSQICLKYFNGVHWATSSRTGLNEFSLILVWQVRECFFLHRYVLPWILYPVPFVSSSVSVSLSISSFSLSLTLFISMASPQYGVILLLKPLLDVTYQSLKAYWWWYVRQGVPTTAWGVQK